MSSQKSPGQPKANVYNLVSAMSIGFLTLECHERIKVIIDKKKVDDLPPLVDNLTT